MMRFVMKLMVLTATFSVFAGLAFADSVNQENGLALKGYDPVSYFTDSKPVLGKAEFTAIHDGATYRFTDAKHRDMFVADPVHYAPQYGGFCAFGVSQGHKADITPAAFTIVQDKLYLNYNADVMAIWRKDIPGFIAKAAASWAEVSKQTEVAH
jgi:hypothetical protein